MFMKKFRLDYLLNSHSVLVVIFSVRFVSVIIIVTTVTFTIVFVHIFGWAWTMRFRLRFAARSGLALGPAARSAVATFGPTAPV